MTTIYVVAYPKSGGVWLCRLLGDVLDSPIGAVYPSSSNKAIGTEGENRKGEYYIRHGHPSLVEDKGGPVVPGIHKFAYKNLTTEKVIVLLRDPRDIVVSGSYHWDRPLREYINCVANGKWPMTHGGGLVPWVRMWLDSELADCITRYEWLWRNTAKELQRILGRLGVGQVKPIHEVVARQEFNQRREWTKKHGDLLNYGKDFQVRFLRKGIVGDWRNHLGPEETALCEKHFGDLMRELGYVDK